MSLNIYDFKKFDGYAKTKDQGDYELRIYLKGKCNVETAICSHIIDNGESKFFLYNFIVDKDHLKNMEDMNWFGSIKEITLYVDKITPYLSKFITYALKNKVDVKLITLPF